MIVKPLPKLDFTEEISTIGKSCPKCGGYLELDTEYKDREGEVTHWRVICSNCGARGILFND